MNERTRGCDNTFRRETPGARGTSPVPVENGDTAESAPLLPPVVRTVVSLTRQLL